MCMCEIVCVCVCVCVSAFLCERVGIYYTHTTRARTLSHTQQTHTHTGYDDMGLGSEEEEGVMTES